MGARVRKARGEVLETVGHGELVPIGSAGIRPWEYVLIGTHEGTGPASLASLRQALIRWRRRRHDPAKGEARVWIGLLSLSETKLKAKLDEEDWTWLHEEYLKSPPTPVALLLDQERLLIRVSIWVARPPVVATARRTLAPLLKRYKATCRGTVVDLDGYPEGGFSLELDLERAFEPGATVADGWRFGDEARALLRARKGGEITQGVAVDLLSAGRWELFSGQAESDWLEAKGEPYDHLRPKLGDNWRFELAKDVAALANSPEGGVIAIGLTTKDRGNGDVIVGHKEFDLRRVDAATYRRHIAQLVYPRVVGFEVRRVEGRKSGSGFAILIVPPQNEWSLPFLVNGAISKGKVLGSYVLLPVRREDDTALADISAIHARLRLGEQAIRGEKSRGPR